LVEGKNIDEVYKYYSAEEETDRKKTSSPTHQKENYKKGPKN